ncbi:hypothetical protein I6F36_21175 [Bradyrhizobium sp. BRP19]|uniref:hypothetical protein n=1 Tax=Bradyrhizobium sp. BRP19 TaxID=2793823 RepID=UPI001CD68712|nr:hypothetical protein [Bradyrhizobium sp. BRP19]MCA1549346.1 hypothetical protein [Bradyrhizobium sp. BRP19]
MTMTKKAFCTTFGIARGDLVGAPDAFDASAMLCKLISKHDPEHAAEIVVGIMQTLEQNNVPQAA